MKTILALCLLVATPCMPSAWAADVPASKVAANGTVSGEVLEVKDIEAYTYLRLKTKDGETWAAVSTAAVKKGSKVTIENAMVMNNFESKALKKTFQSIVFGNLNATGAAKTEPSPHAGTAKPADPGPIKVTKATGADAYTVAEIYAKATHLKDKPVRVSGKVVKYNPGIMGKNWIHLQDGSGSAASGSNDILVTSASPTKVGDVLTIAGTVRNDKDFGAGYVYKVLIEDATFKP